MRKLSSLGSRSLAHRKGRSLLTGAGIVLGVAILFGVLVANATTQRGVDLLVEDFTGRADVVAEPLGVFDADLEPGTVEALAALPEVEEAVGRFGFRTLVPDRHLPDSPDEPARLGIAGIVPDEATKIRNFTINTGRFPAPGADEVMISVRLAEDLGVGMGDRLTVGGEAQTRQLEVAGLLEYEGAARGPWWGMTIAFTSMETAHALAGRAPGTYGGADLILAQSVDTEAWIDVHREAVPGVRLQNAETLAAGFKQFLDVFGTFLTFFAAITLFVGAFLIYLTLSMAVIERTRVYGTLRALGATKPQVRRVVLTEALALGVVSTVVGLAFGLGLAKGLLVLIGAIFDLELPGLQVTIGAVAAAVIVGLAVTTGSALLPAVRAGRLAPVDAMKGDHARDTRLGRTWMVGAVLFVFFGAVQASTIGSGPESAMAALGPPSFLGMLLGVVLLVPLLLRPLASVLGRITNRLARGVGDIAVLHLAKERSRSAYTLALVMVVMAMMFASGGLYLSVQAAAEQIIDRQFGADMFIDARTGDASLEARLQDDPDIAAFSPIRFGEVAVLHNGGENGARPTDRTPYFVRTIEPQSYFQISGYFWTEGSDDRAFEGLMAGNAVLISNDVARRTGASLGDQILMETRLGTPSFEVAGIYTGPPGPPELTMGLPDAEQHLTIGAPMGYLADVRPGADVNTVVRRLATGDPERPLDVETASELRELAQGQVSTYFQIVYAILAIAATVGLLGLANTLAMSVLHRFREIGILRAIGVTRSQTWRMVLVESSTMGLAAFLLSVPLGWLLTYIVVRGASEGFGFTMETLYPWAWMPFVAAFGIVIAVIAAIAPGRRAARLHVVSALQYE